MKEERNDDQLLLRLPSGMKSRMETAAKVEGMTTQEWIREALQSRLCLLNVCPNCSQVNAGKAKFCSECGTPLLGASAEQTEGLRVVRDAPWGE